MSNSTSKSEFHFILKAIIISRNENGATLSQIKDDYSQLVGISLETLFGPNWSDRLRNVLINEMNNIFTRTLAPGFALYFMNVDVFKMEVSSENLSEDEKVILEKLRIDPNNIKPFHVSKGREVNRSIQITEQYTENDLILPEFYNNTLIGDDFFLELSHIDLKRRKIKHNHVQCIGFCISGQTIKDACNNIKCNSSNIKTKSVIVNVGIIDLLNGSETLIEDILALLTVIKEKNLVAIITTLSPIAYNDNSVIEKRRQNFNKYLRENFQLIIDIEQCFLSSEGCVLNECYQVYQRNVTGCKEPLILWNRIGRQRVLQKMKKALPLLKGLIE